MGCGRPSPDDAVTKTPRKPTRQRNHEDHEGIEDHEEIDNLRALRFFVASSWLDAERRCGPPTQYEIEPKSERPVRLRGVDVERGDDAIARVRRDPVKDRIEGLQ